MRGSFGLAVFSIGCLAISAGAAPAFARQLVPNAEPPCEAVPCAAPHDANRYVSTERERNFFLRHLLLDALWLPTDSSTRSIGLIGGHLAVANIGRLYIYGPPGVMLLRGKGDRGQSVLQTAYTWGFSYHVTEFSVPGMGRRAVLFVNIAKCWTHGDERNGNNVAGLSVAWKR